MSDIFTTTIRLNLTKEDDRRAWMYLQTMDRERYKSYSHAVTMAINDYFSRQARLASDPYLETREKEDAFLRRVQDAVARGMQTSNANSLGNLAVLLHSVQPTAASASKEMADADFDTAMDFINGL